MNRRIGARIAAAKRVLLPAFLRWCLAVCILCLSAGAMAQMGTSTPLPPAERQKAEAESKAAGALTNYPHLVDITESTRIHFEHLSSPEAKFIAESMSGGVALIDYDGDGWPDIYFTNAQSVDMALHGTKARSALFHNNHDGTFTDVTDKAGVGYPCWAMGAAVGDATTATAHLPM
jgi:enediyne biosynthesis protein E4